MVYIFSKKISREYVYSGLESMLIKKHNHFLSFPQKIYL